MKILNPEWVELSKEYPEFLESDGSEFDFSKIQFYVETHDFDIDEGNAYIETFEVEKYIEDKIERINIEIKNLTKEVEKLKLIYNLK